MVNTCDGNILMQSNNIYFVRSFHIDTSYLMIVYTTCYKIKNVIFHHLLFMANLSLK